MKPAAVVQHSSFPVSLHSEARYFELHFIPLFARADIRSGSGSAAAIAAVVVGFFFLSYLPLACNELNESTFTYIQQYI